MLGHVLGRIDGTMLPSGTTTDDHEVAESTIHIAFYRCIYQLVGMVEERGDFSILFQKMNHRLIQSCEVIIAFILTGVVDGPAVEYKTTPIALRVIGYSLLVGKTEDLDLQNPSLLIVCELLQLCQLAQELVEIGILRIVLAQQASKILDGKGDTLDKVGFLLEITTESVGSQHL